MLVPYISQHPAGLSVPCCRRQAESQRCLFVQLTVGRKALAKHVRLLLTQGPTSELRPVLYCQSRRQREFYAGVLTPAGWFLPRTIACGDVWAKLGTIRPRCCFSAPIGPSSSGAGRWRGLKPHKPRRHPREPWRREPSPWARSLTTGTGRTGSQWDSN